MSHPNLQITDAEWEVMQAVWQAKDQGAGEIIARVQESRSWNHRTIRTLLTRLVKKDAIEVWTEGSKHFYRAAVSRQECVRSAAKSFSERFFAGDVKSLLMHFVENEGISNAELEDIRRSLLAQEPPQRGKRRKGS
jgi:BlaI family transcriptional regulator, penicillinase repressor